MRKIAHFSLFSPPPTPLNQIGIRVKMCDSKKVIFVDRCYAKEVAVEPPAWSAIDRGWT
jgi:hypothetical protein